MEQKETIIYAALFFGIIIAGSLMIPFVNSGPKLDVDSQGKIMDTEKNQKIFAEQAEELNSECGDLESEANIQHLSHHPDRYSECLKQVDAKLLKKATGKTLEEMLN